MFDEKLQAIYIVYACEEEEKLAILGQRGSKANYKSNYNLQQGSAVQVVSSIMQDRYP